VWKVRILYFLSIAAACASLNSCTLTAKAYPVAGPAAKSKAILLAKFTWAGGGTGKVTVTMPDGEVCEGRYATVVGGIVSPDMAAIGANSSTAIAVSSVSVSTGDIRGLQTSRAMLMGDRGTMMEFEGYTSGANPTHGFCVAKDDKGSVWKIIW
jgi:hypothetical protein